MSILTDGWGEILIYQFEKLLKNTSIERLNKGILGKKSFDGGELKNAMSMRIYEFDKRFNVLHYNNWLDPIICSIPKDKVTIFESHSIHFGLDLKNTLYDLETPLKRFLGFFIHFIYKFIFRFKVKKFDLYFTSIPSALPYARKIRSDAIWLPNAIDFEIFEKDYDLIKLDTNYINIFLPSSVRVQKNQQKAWEIIENFSKKYDNLRIYMIDHTSSNYDLIKEYTDKYREKIIKLPMVDRSKIGGYYKSNFDIVFGSLWHADDYAMLNMIELEAMACKVPIVAMDSFEIIKTKYEDIEKLSWKILEDKDFRKEYIERNYNYVKEIHSLPSVANFYISKVEAALESKKLI